MDETRTFSVNAGTFVAEHKKVWVHCLVDVCHVDDVSIECNRMCKGDHTVKQREDLPEEKLRLPTKTGVHLHSG